MKTLVCLVVALVALGSGVAALGSSPHIAGGEEAPKRAYMFAVNLEIRRQEGMSVCGGALLARNWILTSAACMQGYIYATATVQAHYFGYEPSQQAIPVRQVVLHPDWNNSTMKNDIALVNINEQRIAGFVFPINLPTYSQKTLSFWRSPVTITGWGITKDGSDEYSKTLQHVSLEVATNFYCNLRYFTTRFDDSMMCASGWGKGTCMGDSGAPMFITEEDGTKVVIGIESVHGKCGGSMPVGLTKVTHYLEWIYKVTELTPRN